MISKCFLKDKFSNLFNSAFVTFENALISKLITIDYGVKDEFKFKRCYY